MTASIRGLSLGVALILLAAGSIRLPAQGLARSADALYADASAKETAVRKVLAAPRPPVNVLKAVRTVVLDYESIVRRYPDDVYADDALWRAALLSSDAFRVFGDPAEQDAATRLLRTLVSQYPASPLSKQGPALIAELTVLPPKGAVALAREPAAPPAASAPRTVTIAPPAAPAAAPASRARTAQNAIATLRDIRRVTLPDVVRVVIELDREVSFHDERLSNPNRVFVDLRGATAAATLRDQTLRFETDADPVRQVRLGRHPNNTTRVVLDADGVSSYSVYSLYNPFRLVIDCLREQPLLASSARPAVAKPDAISAPAVMADAAKTPPPPVVPAASTSTPTAGSKPVTAPRMEPRPPVAEALPPFPIVKPVAPPPPVSARRFEPWSRSTPEVASLNASAIRLAADDTLAELPAVRVTQQAVAPPLVPVIEPPSRILSGGLSIARQLGLGVSRIVIDPGHGGHDPGARGNGSSEAALVLDVALRLEKLLQNNADMDVVLTRRTDEYVTLQERTAIANRAGADLFLSIHANSSNTATARGVETYFLDFANTRSAAATAARENAAAGQSMGELPDVVKAIALNNKLQESKDFATYVQQELVQRLGASGRNQRDLGVKQAPFQVLIGAAMPSILAEIAFLSNAQEAKLVRQPAYRQKIAEALFNAVRKYQQSLSHVSTAKVGQD